MADHRQQSLLIVEDSPIFRELLRGVFERRHPGTRVLEAETVSEGRRLALEHGPRVIVMDVQLPDGNGIDLTRSLKEAMPHVHVAVCTAHDLPEHREAALAGGAAHFSCKDCLGDGRLLAFVSERLGHGNGAGGGPKSEMGEEAGNGWGHSPISGLAHIEDDS